MPWVFAVSLSGSPARGASGDLLDAVLERLRQDSLYAGTLSPAALAEGALKRAAERFDPVVFRSTDGGGVFLLTANDHVVRFERSRLATWAELSAAVVRARDFLSSELPRENGETLIETALIDGLLRAADANAQLFGAEAYREFLGTATGEFGGIGLIVTTTGGSIVVDEVVPGAPASRSGIRPGDRVVEVGSRFVDSVSLEEAVEGFRGEAGEPLTLGILSPGERVPRRVTIVRRLVFFPSVLAHWIEEGEAGRIRYLRLRSFQPETRFETTDALRPAYDQAPGPMGLILDLRGNSGGDLDQAAGVADFFLSEGEIVTTIHHGGEPIRTDASFAPNDGVLPLVVLVDEGSASSAEVLAGALKNRGRAVLIGQRTHGKATVQSILPLPQDHRLKLTVARYEAPGGFSPEGRGVTPHIALRILSLAPDAMRLAISGPQPPRTALPQGDSALAGELPAVTLLLLGTESETERAALAAGEPADDPVLRLAEKVLVRHGRRDPRTLLQTTLAVAAQESASTDARIEARLNGLGVDWRGTETGPGARLSLAEPELRVWREGGGWRTVEGPIVPGSRVRLKLAVSNSGKAAAARVLALVRGESDAGAAFDIPLGWIEPGQTLIREQEWRLPLQMLGPLGVFRIELADSSGGRIVERRLLVPVAPPPMSRVEAEVAVREEGNGNAESEPGEVFGLAVRIKNAGATGSAGARLLLEWTAGGWEPLDETALNVPPLAIGNAWSTTIRFRSTAPAGGDLGGIVLRVRDLDYEQARLEHRLVLTRQLPRTPVVLIPPVIDWEPPPSQTPSAEFRLAGHLRDDRAAEDVIARVNGRKVAYAAASTHARSPDLPFEFTIPLDPGWNRVVVDGYDDQRLLTRRTFGVWREGK